MRLFDADEVIKRIDDLLDEIQQSLELPLEWLKTLIAFKLSGVKGITVRDNWISVRDALPEDDKVSVLAVKQLKDGRREVCIARCIPNWESKNYTTGESEIKPYWVCGGNNNIIYWMPLPAMPEEVEG